jgi:hypothetical protein
LPPIRQPKRSKTGVSSPSSARAKAKSISRSAAWLTAASQAQAIGALHRHIDRARGGLDHAAVGQRLDEGALDLGRPAIGARTARHRAPFEFVRIEAVGVAREHGRGRPCRRAGDGERVLGGGLALERGEIEGGFGAGREGFGIGMLAHL